jgi:hypothetical protein
LAGIGFSPIESNGKSTISLKQLEFISWISQGVLVGWNGVGLQRCFLKKIIVQTVALEGKKWLDTELVFRGCLTG